MRNVVLAYALVCSCAFAQQESHGIVAGFFSGTPPTFDWRLGLSIPNQTGAFASMPSTCTVGQMYFAIDQTAGKNLYGCTTTNTWTLESGSSGSSSSSSPPPGLMVSYVNATQLSIGGNCSSSTPCYVRAGDSTYTYTSNMLATLSSGSGTAYVYITSDGTVVVGNTMTVSCSGGCLAQSGISAFPSESIPLATWAASSGAWSATGQNVAATLSRDIILAGTGLVSSVAGGTFVLSADTSLIGFRAPVPATSSASCATGNWSSDTSFFYICVSTNAWKRVAIASW